uniref:RoaA n=1 Tax=Euglena viridis TaxID=3040 RepID=A0A0G3VGI8_EUGVI|nr:RoaA [Euglena viridis]
MEIDNFNFLSSQDKLHIVLNLKYIRFSDKKTPLFFMKNNGLSLFYKNFSLYDNSFQALISLACLPITEFTVDRSVYGFRPYRDCSDLLMSIKSFFLKHKRKDFWCLDVKVFCSFNYLNKFWIIKNFPLEKKVLNSWFTRKSTISINSCVLGLNNIELDSILFNYLFNGLVWFGKLLLTVNATKFLTEVLEKFFFNNRIYSEVKIIRVFHNIFIFSNFPDKFQFYKLLLVKFFNLRSIKFSKELFITHSFYEGFEFLGWKLQKSPFHFLLTQVSKNNIKSYKLELKTLIKKSSNINLFKTLIIINLKIDKWLNSYYLSDFCNDISNDLDLYVYKLFWRFVKRCHPRRSNTWIYYKYWKNLSGSWKFVAYDSLNNRICVLKSHKISMGFSFAFPLMLNIFDKCNDRKIYITLYEKNKRNFSDFYFLIYKKQKGLCFCCHRSLDFSRLKLVNLSSFTTKKKLNVVSNLYLFHLYCKWPY